MSIQKVFDQGRSGMTVGQKGLSVTSHNIANVNTDGYSRQRLEVENVDPSDFGAARVGGGARARAVSRAHSDFISRRLEKEGTELSGAKITSGIYSQIENVFANDSEQGLSKAMSNFFNEVRNLSTDPTSIPMRSAVVETAKGVAKDFNRIGEALDDIRVDLDNRVEGSVLKVNTLTQRIAELNQRIMSIEGTHGFANDERDQRDLALKELSGMIDLQVSNIEHGGVNVSSGRIGTLVSGVDATQLGTVRGETKDYPDAVKVVVKGSGSSFQDVTNFVKGGELGSYVATRDQYVSGIRSDVDSIARSFAAEVNNVNRNGYDLRGEKGGDVFHVGGGQAARSIVVSQDLQANPNLLSGSMEKGAIGDNKSFLSLVNLETQAIMGDQKTILDFNSELIGRIGMETRSAMDSLETQEGIYAQLENLREEEAGVSLDEEAMNMVKFQKAFDASAKVIQVADSMLDTVLSLKRF